MMRVGQVFGRIVGTAALLGVAFAGGVSYKDLRAMPPGQPLKVMLRRIRTDVASALVTAAHGQAEAYTPYEMYADVLATLRANYFGKAIDPTQMTYNGIRGMMGAVHDRYTRFLDPKAYKDMMEENHGDFVGIGALLGTNKQQQVYVVRVLPKTPALRAGVMAGDIIMKVDSHPTLKMKDTDVVKLIRGEPNTKVTLTMLRKSAAKPVIITITRDVVQTEVVQHTMIDPANKIGYVQLSVFNEESDVQLGKALADLQSQGMRGLIFDLRENPGGLLDVAREVASRFIPNGPIVWIKDRSETAATMEHLDVDTGQHRNHLKYPLVVLVNGNSASAAEIVSGAIKDTGAGVLVGEKTFGKGLVQTIMSLPDGSAVAITTQHYFTASKNDINHKGIEPNIVVHYSDADQRKMFAFQRDHPDAFYDIKYDTQLQRAMSAVRDQMRVASARPW
ncbi:MAG: S41 family peptidase [Armatimonadetes bacterium]|nr:S41 family peptidase [Armatimonadota bacterium]